MVDGRSSRDTERHLRYGPCFMLWRLRAHDAGPGQMTNRDGKQTPKTVMNDAKTCRAKYCIAAFSRAPRWRAGVGTGAMTKQDVHGHSQDSRPNKFRVQGCYTVTSCSLHNNVHPRSMMQTTSCVPFEGIRFL